MFAIRTAVVVALAACATLVDATPRTRYLELVNRANDSVTSVAIADAGADAFRAMPLGEPLRGGGEAITVEVAAERCRYDFRFTFRDGRSAIYRDVDVCRYRGFHIRRLPSRPE